MLPAAALIAVAIEPECNLNSLAVISTFKIHAKVLKREKESSVTSAGDAFVAVCMSKANYEYVRYGDSKSKCIQKSTGEGRVPFRAVMANGFQFMQLHEAVVAVGRPCVGVLKGKVGEGVVHCGPHATVFASR